MPCANHEKPTKAVGRRETLDPPVSWSRVQARRPRARRKPRRDAGNSRGTGARKSGSGKQQSVVRIVRSLSAASRKTNRRPGGLARSRSLRRWRGVRLGPEKGLGFGWGSNLRGEARGVEAPRRRVYKHVPERIGVRSLLRNRQTFGACLRFCLAPQGARLAWLERRAGGHKPAELTARRKAFRVVPPSSLESTRERGAVSLLRGRTVGRSWSSGSIWLRVRENGARGGSCRSAWNRHGGARGRQETSEDGMGSVKAPPAAAERGWREGFASRTPRGVAAHESSRAAPGSAWRPPAVPWGQRVHPAHVDPKRAMANSCAHPCRLRPRERLWSRKDSRSERRFAATEHARAWRRGVRVQLKGC